MAVDRTAVTPEPVFGRHERLRLTSDGYKVLRADGMITRIKRTGGHLTIEMDCAFTPKITADYLALVIQESEET